MLSFLLPGVSNSPAPSQLFSFPILLYNNYVQATTPNTISAHTPNLFISYQVHPSGLEITSSSFYRMLPIAFS
jgi:hypothetical protein